MGSKRSTDGRVAAVPWLPGSAAESRVDPRPGGMTAVIGGTLGRPARVARRAMVRRPDRLDAVLLVATIGLIVWLVAGVVNPGFHLKAIEPALDIAFDTIGLLACLGVATLAWLRYLEDGDPFNAFQAAAFVVLALPNAVHLVVMTANPGVVARLSLADQGQAPLYAFSAANLVAASLLVLGASIHGARWQPRSWRAILLVPAGVVVAVITATLFWPSVAPLLATVSPAVGEAPGTPTPTPPGLVLGAVIGALFLVAAALSRHRVRRSGNIGQAYVAVGLVFAAFAQIDGLDDPSYAGVVSSADLLRLAFYQILLIGLVAEIHATLRALAASKVEVERLADAEVKRAALDERSRLSRELHDGVAQLLWLAKLKASRLSAAPDLPPDLEVLAAEVYGAVDAGLQEARQAVATLRIAAEPGRSLVLVLARTVDDFGDRFGLPTTFECPVALPSLEIRTQAELLRIVQEALANVARHADATAVTVRVVVEEAEMGVAILDDGRGFDPTAVGAGHFGIASMRERAELISGELDVESRPEEGTSIRLTFPLPIGSSPAGESAE